MGTKIVFVDECHVPTPEWWGYSCVLLPAEQICRLHDYVEAEKTLAGFPRRRPQATARFSLEEYREFKFNPGKRNWMRQGLEQEERVGLAGRFLAKLRELGGGVMVSLYQVEPQTPSREATRRARINLIERIKKHIGSLEGPHVALLIIDQAGSRNQNREHIEETQRGIQWGTWYEEGVREFLYAPVIAEESHRHAGLQIADWVGGASIRAAVVPTDPTIGAWLDIRQSLQECGGPHWGWSFKARGESSIVRGIRRRLFP